MNKKISDISVEVLPVKIKSILIKKNAAFSVGQVFKTSNVDFIAMGLTDDEIDALKTVASTYIQGGKFSTVQECSSISSLKWLHITFGCSALDGITRNGVPVRGITEIVGRPGVGKTQICLQLALNVQMPLSEGGLGKGAVYICTEENFLSNRLVQILDQRKEVYSKEKDWLSNIFVANCRTKVGLENLLCYRLPPLMYTHNIGLIIIDSVAGIFRLETDAINRATNMRKFVYKLQQIAYDHECAVICVNQVTSVVNENIEDRCVPALGLAWSSLVTTQLKIRKSEKKISPNKDTKNAVVNLIQIRTLEVAFSPELPRQTAEFIITGKGVCDVDITF